MHVAFGRVKNITNLFFISSNNLEAIKINNDIGIEYNRLRADCTFFQRMI